MEIILIVLLGGLGLGVILFPIVNSVYLVLNFLSTVLAFGALLFVILYYPLDLANKNWAKGIFRQREETTEKALERAGAEIAKVDAECEAEEQKKNPDWKKELRQGIDSDMRNSRAAGIREKYRRAV